MADEEKVIETVTSESTELSAPGTSDLTQSSVTERNDANVDELAQPQLSKKQLKRKRRLEKLMEVKERRKSQEREAKKAKAIAAGRDLEEERRQVEQRTKDGEGKRQRDEFWLQKKLPLAKNSFEVCLDCCFEDDMTPKEINSLALQIRYCYSNNRHKPCFLAATSVTGKTLEHLKNVSGYEEWGNRAFTITDQSMEEYYEDRMDRIVYLTSDSETTLHTLDNSKIYVIGGIVDRNRLKKAALNRAHALGVATAKLPIDEHMKMMGATRVLTCNHVFEILQHCRFNGNDWKKALLEVLPRRKDITAREDESIYNSITR
jgi:tRNA (guanine9-N1)-methyltransferase